MKKAMLEITVPKGITFRDPKSKLHVKNKDNIDEELTLKVDDTTFWRRRINKKEVKLVKAYELDVTPKKKEPAPAPKKKVGGGTSTNDTNNN